MALSRNILFGFSILFLILCLTSKSAMAETPNAPSGDSSCTAFDCYLEKAKQGDSDAQYTVAQMYDQGNGVEKDEEAADEWFLKAAQGGHAKAQIEVGKRIEYYDFTEDYINRQAFEWYLKAAEQGNAEGQYWVAYSYTKGRGVSKDYQSAIPWMEKASAQGNAQASYFLVALYYWGIGVEKDNEQAMQWYLKALEQSRAQNKRTPINFFSNPPEEQNLTEKEMETLALEWLLKAVQHEQYYVAAELGKLYCCAKGIERDRKAGLEWYLKAAEQGNPDAQYRAANMYAAGCDTEHSPEKAQALYLQAAENGHSKAQLKLGRLYAQGETGGTGEVKKPDYAAAMQWLLKAAEHKNADAYVAIAWLYTNGHGVEKNDEEAVKWLQKAVDENSHPKAAYALAFAYTYGRGVEADGDKAVDYLIQAAQSRNKKIANDARFLILSGITQSENPWLLIINAQKPIPIP